MSKSGSCLRQSRNKHFISTWRKLNARLKGCEVYGLTSFGKNMICDADLGGGSAHRVVSNGTRMTNQEGK
jgi:hypothetical protein